MKAMLLSVALVNGKYSDVSYIYFDLDKGGTYNISIGILSAHASLHYSYPVLGETQNRLYGCTTTNKTTPT